VHARPAQEQIQRFGSAAEGAFELSGPELAMGRATAVLARVGGRGVSPRRTLSVSRAGPLGLAGIWVMIAAGAGCAVAMAFKAVQFCLRSIRHGSMHIELYHCSMVIEPSFRWLPAGKLGVA
jgi:hypothetical protein